MGDLRRAGRRGMGVRVVRPWDENYDDVIGVELDSKRSDELNELWVMTRKPPTWKSTYTDEWLLPRVLTDAIRGQQPGQQPLALPEDAVDAQ